MARKVTPIDQINDSKETWKVEVRITNLIVREKAEKIVGMDMILMDDKGDKITAIVKQYDIAKWKSILKENSIYIVQNFEVAKNEGQYKISPHRFKLIFGKGTIVHEHHNPHIPQNVYHFTKFEDILSGQATSDQLVDVIGEFADIQYNKITTPKRLVFVMKDQRDNSIFCTLWEDYADKMIKFLESHQSGPIIILLNLARIKDSYGKYPTSIQNSMYGSKVLINEDIAEIQQYKDSLASNVVYESFSERITQFSSGSQTSSEDKFMENAEVKSLMELGTVQKDCYCITVAKIDKLCVSNGWSYQACFKCNKKANCSTMPFICEGCGKKISETVPRFRVEVIVSYKNENSKFVLWDRECIQLIKETALDLKKKLLDDGETEPMAVPESIDCILGKVLAFKVKVQPGYKHYSVSQISDNKHIVDGLQQKMKIDEDDIDSPKKKSTSSIVKEGDSYDTQSISGSADYDPGLTEYLTPAKRRSNDIECDDYYAEKELPSAQVSSTKFSKNIKTEKFSV